METENEKPTPTPRKGLGVYQIFEAGILGVAFAVFYAFGILRFASAITQIWGRTAAIVSSVFAVCIAIAFIDAISKIINDSRKNGKDIDA